MTERQTNSSTQHDGPGAVISRIGIVETVFLIVFGSICLAFLQMSIDSMLFGITELQYANVGEYIPWMPDAYMPWSPGWMVTYAVMAIFVIAAHVYVLFDIHPHPLQEDSP